MGDNAIFWALFWVIMGFIIMGLLNKEPAHKYIDILGKSQEECVQMCKEELP